LSVLVAFFDQHDRDAVAYGIPSATGRAGEKRFVQHDLFTASGTNQNVQKLLTDQSSFLPMVHLPPTIAF